MLSSTKIKLPKPIDLYPSFGILFFVFLTFFGEGRLRLDDFLQVIHSLGAGGHHENLITILRKSIDHTYLKGDIYTDNLRNYPIPLVEAMKYLYQLGLDFNTQSIILEWTGRVFLITAIYSLTRFLVPSKLAPFLILIFFIRTRASIGDYPPFSHWNPNMEISMALCLFSMLVFLKEKRELAAMLASAGTLFHYRFPFLILFFYFLWIMFNWRTIKLKTLIIGTAGAILLSLPYLSMIGPHLTVHISDLNNEISKLIIYSAIADEFSPLTSIVVSWPRLAFLFFISIIGIRFFFSQENKISIQTKNTLKLFLLFCVTLLIIQLIFTGITLSLFMLKIQFHRVTQFWLLLMMIWTSQWIITYLQKSPNNLIVFFLFPFLLLLYFSDTFFHFELGNFNFYPFFLFPLFLLIFLLFKENSLGKAKNEFLSSKCLVWIIIFGIISSTLYFKRVLDISPTRWKLADDWKSVQIWAEKNSSRDSVFFTPTGVPGFRTFSKRSSVGGLYDLHLAVSMNPQIAIKVHQRLKDIEYPMVKSLDERHSFWGENGMAQRTNQNHNKLLNLEKFISIRKKIKFDYVVRHKKMPLNLEKRYSNGSFIIYKMKEVSK